MHVELCIQRHDYQLVCPNHMMNNPIRHENCELCLGDIIAIVSKAVVYIPQRLKA